MKANMTDMRPAASLTLPLPINTLYWAGNTLLRLALKNSVIPSLLASTQVVITEVTEQMPDKYPQRQPSLYYSWHSTSTKGKCVIQCHILPAHNIYLQQALTKDQGIV